MGSEDCRLVRRDGDELDTRLSEDPADICGGARNTTLARHLPLPLSPQG